MSSTTYSEAQLPTGAQTGWRRSYSRISWGAVLAGAAVAAATMILLSLLGVALGATGLHWAHTTTGYGVGAGLWTIVNVILSMAFGGYVAARLSGTHSHLDGELHGITVWAIAILIATAFLAAAASEEVVIVATGAGVDAGSQGQPVNPQTLTERLQQSLSSNGDPTQMTRSQITTEISALIWRRVVNGTFTAEERDRLTALVAADAGIGKEEAARRVARIEQDAASTVAQAEQEAAIGRAHGARALASALILGLGAAMLGAWVGTRHARVVTPAPEATADTHTTTYVTHHTAYDPQVAPTRLHFYDDIPAYLRGISFPATKLDLLRVARANNYEPAGLRKLEQIADRSYGSLHDVMVALAA
jgi:hypothetical protein